VDHDQKQHFAIANSRIAKASFAREVINCLTPSNWRAIAAMQAADFLPSQVTDSVRQSVRRPALAEHDHLQVGVVVGACRLTAAETVSGDIRRSKVGMAVSTVALVSSSKRPQLQ
jgi:hypothetical protein